MKFVNLLLAATSAEIVLVNLSQLMELQNLSGMNINTGVETFGSNGMTLNGVDVTNQHLDPNGGIYI